MNWENIKMGPYRSNSAQKNSLFPSEITWSLFPYTVTESSYFTVQHWMCFNNTIWKQNPAFYCNIFCNLSCELSPMFSANLPDHWWPTLSKDSWGWPCGILAQIHTDGNLPTLSSIYQREALQIKNLLWIEPANVLLTLFTPNIRKSCL